MLNRWTIDTKYYTADVSIWMAHLHDEFSSTFLPDFSQFAAIVMVFDMSEARIIICLSGHCVVVLHLGT